MPTRDRKTRQFHNRLNRIRYAFGFLRHEHHDSGDKKGQPDPSKGAFPSLFFRHMQKAWAELGAGADGAPPSDVTVKRWFTGETDPAADKYPGIVRVLNTILTLARKDPNFLKNAGATGDFLFDEKFYFSEENLNQGNEPHKLAEQIGFPIGDYEEWWGKAEIFSLKNGLDASAQKYVGVYFAFRFPSDQQDYSRLRQGVVVIKMSKEGAGLELSFIGSRDGPPWTGGLQKGQNTLSALISRSNEEIGTHINTVTLVHDSAYPNILHGFRTRIVERNTRHIAAYRLILWRPDDEDLQEFTKENLEDDNVLDVLKAHVRELEVGAPGQPEIIQHIADSLAEEQSSEIDDHPQFQKNSHNLFSLRGGLREYLRNTIRERDNDAA